MNGSLIFVQCLIAIWKVQKSIVYISFTLKFIVKKYTYEIYSTIDYDKLMILILILITIPHNNMKKYIMKRRHTKEIT